MENDEFIINCIDLEELIAGLTREAESSYLYRDTAAKVNIVVVERFFFRIESNLAATVIFDRINDSQYHVTIIVAGGKHGLLGFTYGAEGSMLKKLKKSILMYSQL